MANNTTTSGQIDPATETDNLANIFFSLSQAVDNFRFAPRNPPLTDAQASRLKDESQALDDRAHHFTAEAIGATLQSIQGNLTNIKSLTANVKHQVQNLNDVDKVIKIVTSALTLGTAIAAGNVPTILSATQALAGAI
jgi:hypothetical protein